MKQKYQLIPATPAHYSAMVALNNAAMPAVSELSAEKLKDLTDIASYCKVVVCGNDAGGNAEEVAAFLLGLSPGQDYSSDNYRWFDATYESFVYIDRVVVAPAHIGQSIGRCLYEDVQHFAENQNAARLACEVNLRPPNPESAAFHHRLGFTEVARQPTENNTKEVALMTKPLLHIPL